MVLEGHLTSFAPCRHPTSKEPWGHPTSGDSARDSPSPGPAVLGDVPCAVLGSLGFGKATGRKHIEQRSFWQLSEGPGSIVCLSYYVCVSMY